MITHDDVSKFKRDGYLLVKGLLSPEEVARFRNVHFPGTNADLSSLPILSDVWSDTRLVDIARRLLGDSVTFFGEASYRHSTYEDDDYAAGRIHHDAKGTIAHLFDRQHQPTPEPYPIIRFGFYLQDHASHSGGLKIVPGSHQMDSSDFNEAGLNYLDVPTEPGDAVVFCNKLLHAAHALRPKSGPSVSPREQERLASIQPDHFCPRAPDRRVFFVDYAGADELADVYIKSRALNPSSLSNGFALLAADEGFVKKAEEIGVRLRLDAAVVEAVTNIFGTAGPDGALSDVGRTYAAILPRLCRLSRSWSAHFDFIPSPPSDDSVDTGVRLAMELGANITGLRELLKTRRSDAAMKPQASAVSN